MYDDWVNGEATRYSKSPYNDDTPGEVYGWIGDGYYYMDENGMLVGGRHDAKQDAEANRDRVVALQNARLSP